MQTASFEGILKTIFYFIAFYYVFKFLARVFLPILMKKAVQKASENFQQQSNESFQNRSDSSAPDMQSASKNANPRETKKIGEYVDYEEIE